jgi:hypothetical protein
LLTRGRVRYVPAYTRLPLALGAGATAGGLTNAAIDQDGEFGERFAEGALWGGIGGAGGTVFGELRWPSRLGPRRIETPPHFDEMPLLTSSQEALRAQHPRTTYHVTPRNFRAIDWSLLGSRTGTRRGEAGIYSQWNPRVAAQYADKQARQGHFPRIQPWRIGFRNPLVVKGLPFPMPIAFARGRPAGHWFERARKGGHDGVIFENVLDSPLGYVPLPTTVYVNPRHNPPRHRDALFRAAKPTGDTWNLYTRDAVIEARAAAQGTDRSRVRRRESRHHPDHRSYD